jgi:hypothetical protein
MIALFPGYELARQIATQLVADGFASDRVDVTALRDLGRANAMPAVDAASKIDTYFASILSDLDDEAIATLLSSAVREGGATVTVHPRGDVEIARARKILQSHQPVQLFVRVAPPDAQGGLFGERAAGKR